MLPPADRPEKPAGLQRVPPVAARKVEPLAITGYRLLRTTSDHVVLGCGKKCELWCRADIPRKGYAIRLGDFEYEFEKEVPA